jgi:hypothetical protein
MKIHSDWNGTGIRKDGRAWNFRLALDVSVKKDGYARYHRTSASYFGENKDGTRRKVASVCWHGYRDYMLEVFERDPDARIKTAWADYKGVQGFRELYPATGYRNIGPPIAPIAMSEACACRHSGWLVDLSVEPYANVYLMNQSDIKACPHFIMTPEHYRPDGSCKCDDSEHQEFMIAEWGYSKSDFVSV